MWTDYLGVVFQWTDLVDKTDVFLERLLVVNWNWNRRKIIEAFVNETVILTLFE